MTVPRAFDAAVFGATAPFLMATLFACDVALRALLRGGRAAPRRTAAGAR